jgi:hypothetical protein
MVLFWTWDWSKEGTFICWSWKQTSILLLTFDADGIRLKQGVSIQKQWSIGYKQIPKSIFFYWVIIMYCFKLRYVIADPPNVPYKYIIYPLRKIIVIEHFLLLNMMYMNCAILWPIKLHKYTRTISIKSNLLRGPQWMKYGLKICLYVGSIPRLTNQVRGVVRPNMSGLIECLSQWILDRLLYHNITCL